MGDKSGEYGGKNSTFTPNLSIRSINSFDLIERTGAKVVFLPPYSPDLSPIEKMWSKIKEILKRKKPRSKAEFHDALLEAITSVNEGDFEEWYEACGYSVAA